MRETRNCVVFGRGNADADIAFVAEAPGRDEDLYGEPFKGDTGKFFENELLSLAGLSRNEVYITNACKCRPIDAKGDNRRPCAQEYAACKPILLKELEIVDPKLVVLLGAIPLKSLLGHERRVRHP